jgi:hypothetical protein
MALACEIRGRKKDGIGKHIEQRTTCKHNGQVLLTETSFEWYLRGGCI